MSRSTRATKALEQAGVGFAVLTYDYDPDADIKIPTNTVVWMMMWLVVCMTGAIGPIANAAHVVGLGVGLVVGLTPHLMLDRR